MNRAGRFITVEGIEGVGKSTQMAAIGDILRAQGYDPVLTREPGGTALAEKIRELVLSSGTEPVPSSTELLLMFAARAAHLENLIEPNLRAGRWVLCDRFTDATYAYQGAGRGLPPGDIEWLENFVQHTRRPDLTLLLDVPVHVALTRARTRNAQKIQDRFESEQTEFFERVREGYLRRATAEPRRIVVIDANATVSEVSERIRRVLEAQVWMS
jgi:dTMP kinase